MKKILSVLPLTLFVAACAGGMSGGAAPEPPPPPELDPVGVYDCWLEMEGMEFGLTLTITGTPGAYAGSMDSEVGPGQVTDISIDGNRMSFIVHPADMPGMAAYFSAVFDGDTFTGEFDADGMGGYVSGKKR